MSTTLRDFQKISVYASVVQNFLGIFNGFHGNFGVCFWKIILGTCKGYHEFFGLF